MTGASLDVVLADYVKRVQRFEREVHDLFGGHETAPSRVYILDKTYQELKGLSLKQDDLFRQAIRCIESDLFRAAHVMAWAAFMDFVEEKLAEDGLAKVRAARPKWTAPGLEELRENVVEAQILDVAKELGLLSKSQLKVLQ